MKDAHDNKTLDMVGDLPKKRGRPPSDNPKTDAQRKAKQRHSDDALWHALHFNKIQPHQLTKRQCLHILSRISDAETAFNAKLDAIKRLAELENIKIIVETPKKEVFSFS